MDSVATRDDISSTPSEAAFENGLDLAKRLAGQGDLDQALEVLTQTRRLFPDRRQTYTAAASYLRQKGRMAEAEAWLAAGLPYLSDDLGFALERSWLAFHRRDLPEAIRRWEDVRERFPRHPAWCVGLAVSLRDGGRIEEADALLADMRQKFPSELSIFVEYAWLAHRRADWQSAIARWEDVRRIFPNQSVGYVAGSTTLREAGQAAAAEVLLGDAMARFPDDAAIAEEFAQLAYQRQDWTTARIRWQQLRDRFPQMRQGYLLGARTLLAVGEKEQSLALLAEARRRWPDSQDVLDTCAHIAFERGDSDEAIRLGREMVRLSPGDVNGTFHVARALRDTGQGREAEEFLRDAPERFAGNDAILSIWASLAMLRSDWPDALRRWTLLREQRPDEPKYLWQSANALWRMNRDQEADALLDSANGRFNSNTMVQSMWIEAALRRRNWTAAVQRAAVVRQRFPDLAAGYIHGVKALRQAGRDDLADQLWAEARRRLPEDLHVRRAAADEAMGRRDWVEAERIWTEFRAAQPNDIAGYLGGAATLREAGRHAQADAMLLDTLTRFPSSIAAHAMFASMAQHRNDHDEAIKRWESLRRRFPESESGYLGLARALQDVGRVAEADAVMRDAAGKFQGDPDVAVYFARLAVARADHTAAETRFRAAAERFPSRTDAVIGLADALFETNRPVEAEALLTSSLDKYPDDAAIFAAHASAAMRRLDWKEALRRWTAMSQRFPNDPLVSQRIFEVRLRLAETGPEPAQPASAPEAIADTTNMAELVGQFESLGGAGHGCEFGLFQRHFGAEPLGLLRWADLGYELLTRALETDFDGVGDPEHTELFAPESDRPEYWTRDRRYWMAMRCFIFADQIPYDKMFTQACRRLQYLRRKLIDDLKAGEKIFVFKCIRRSLTEDEILHLHAAVRRYGRNTLLYVAYEDAENPNGTARVLRNGLIVGYVDRFGFSPDERNLGAATDSWAGACRAAYKLWVNGKSEQSFENERVVPAVAAGLGDRILHEHTDTAGPVVPINWSEAHLASLRAERDRHGADTREHAFACIQLDAAAGDLSAARKRFGDLLNRFASLYPQDGYSFDSLVVSAVLASQWDLVRRFVNDKFGRAWCSGVTAEPLPDGGQTIRWDVLPDGTSRFVFDTAVMSRDRAWFELLGFPKSLSLFHDYSSYAHAERGSVRVNIGDGGVVPGLAFCDNRPDYFLVPDSVFLNTGGYQDLRKDVDAQLVPWAQRRPVAFWRGATTGIRRGDWRTLQRVQLCMIAQTAERLFDVGVTSIVGMPPDMMAEAEIAGIRRPFVKPVDFMQCKYQIDIDGNTSAWAALFQKLYTGSPVLKVASRFGFRQWFYDDLKPWRNYVPVEADMSDLIEKVEWLSAHDDQARRIGERGRDLAASMTFARELRRSRVTIGAAMRHFGGHPDVVVRLDRVDDDAGVLLDGWSDIDAGGRWAFGPEARLRIPRPRISGPLTLRLTVAPRPGNGQVMIVVADGRVVHESRVVAPCVVECVLPAERLFAEDSIAVTLLLPDTATVEAARRQIQASGLHVTELAVGAVSI